MVREANVKRAAAEKQLTEAQGKVGSSSGFVGLHPSRIPTFRLLLCDSQIDVLQAEVTALKTLVLTSTPSSPNRQLHPQLQSSGTRGACKHHGHSRNKSTSSVRPPPPGRADAPVQPASKEEREVRSPASASLHSFLFSFPPAVFLFCLCSPSADPFFLSVSGVSSSPQLCSL